MSKLLVALMISIFATASFSIRAADKSVTDLKKSSIAPVTNKQKQPDEDMRDKPLTGQNYQIQAKESLKASPINDTPAKATDAGYMPPPDLNDRNPISN